jgi:hypothetical protein
LLRRKEGGWHASSGPVRRLWGKTAERSHRNRALEAFGWDSPLLCRF